MVVSGGTILSAFFSQHIVNKFKTHWTTIISIFMTAFSLFFMARANAFYQFVLLAIPLGLGAGSIDSALNNYVALHYDAKHMNWLHAFWGVGTTIGPMILSFAILGGGTWQTSYDYLAIIQAIIGVVVLLSIPLWVRKKSKNGEVIAEEKSQTFKVKELFSVKGAPWMFLAFLAYCGFESIANLWGASYFVYSKGYAPEVAATFSALLFFGITAGRMTSGFVSSKINDKNLITYSQIIIILSLILLFVAPTQILHSVAFFLLGFGYAPIYPAQIHQTTDIFDKKYSQAIIGLEMSSAYVGSTFLPPLYGLLAGQTRQWLFPIIVSLLLLLHIIATQIRNKRVGI